LKKNVKTKKTVVIENQKLHSEFGDKKDL